MKALPVVNFVLVVCLAAFVLLRVGPKEAVDSTPQLSPADVSRAWVRAYTRMDLPGIRDHSTSGYYEHLLTAYHDMLLARQLALSLGKKWPEGEKPVISNIAVVSQDGESARVEAVLALGDDSRTWTVTLVRAGNSWRVSGHETPDK